MMTSTPASAARWRAASMGPSAVPRSTSRLTSGSTPRTRASLRQRPRERPVDIGARNRQQAVCCCQQRKTLAGGELERPREEVGVVDPDLVVFDRHLDQRVGRVRRETDHPHDVEVIEHVGLAQSETGRNRSDLDTGIGDDPRDHGQHPTEAIGCRCGGGHQSAPSIDSSQSMNSARTSAGCRISACSSKPRT